MDTDSTRSRAEGDGRSAANQCCDMKADLATIGPEATLKRVGVSDRRQGRLRRGARLDPTSCDRYRRSTTRKIGSSAGGIRCSVRAKTAKKTQRDRIISMTPEASRAPAMKIARLQIENFRHLGGQGQPLVLDFTDALGRVRDFTLLVGPNTCGKTTILDSIAAAMGPSLQMPTLRPHFQRTPRTVVRRGALHARVTCWLQFTPEEIAATRELFKLAERPENVPDTPEVELTWEYPDPAGELDRGFSRCLPRLGWTLLKGRFQVARLLATGRVGWSWFGRVGGVFTFDQQRTGFGKTVSRRAWNIIHGATHPSAQSEQRRTSDPRTILLDLAVRSLVPSPDDRQENDFRLIQEKYALVCAASDRRPHSRR